jgi:ATP-dependent helicase/DNAse subunit B
MGVTRASETLILSCPRFDLEGKESLPSFYVDEVRSLFQGDIPVKRQSIAEILPSWNEVSSAEEAERRVVREIWNIPETKRSGRAERLLFSIYAFLLSRDSFRSVISKLLRPIEGAIRDERILPHFAPKDGVWSPTALEEYAECPYRYFADRILHFESQEEGIDIKRKGNILHGVLEQFFKWVRDEKGGKVDFDEGRAFCLEKFRKSWAEEPLKGDRWYRIELERRNIEEMLTQIVRLEFAEGKPPLEKLIPTHFEIEFGFDPEKGDVLKLRTDRGELFLRGKIDRIDVDKSGKFGLILDYKTGKTFDGQSLEDGTCLQLPLYVLAAEDRLSLKVLGAHFYSLAAGRSSGFHHQEFLSEAGIKTRKGHRLTEQRFRDLLRRTVQYAARFASVIETAQIPVRPRNCVSYCSYSTICRIEKWRLKHIYREIAEEDKEFMQESVKR